MKRPLWKVALDPRGFILAAVTLIGVHAFGVLPPVEYQSYGATVPQPAPLPTASLNDIEPVPIAHPKLKAPDRVNPGEFIVYEVTGVKSSSDLIIGWEFDGAADP